MDRKVRVVQYGAGKMSRYLMRYVLEHGGELVGAFCRNKNHIGKDVSEIIGNGYPTVGVVVEDSATADARIGELKPDVCIIATRSTVAELEDIFTICAHHGVNHLRGGALSVELFSRADREAGQAGEGGRLHADRRGILRPLLGHDGHKPRRFLAQDHEDRRQQLLQR